MATSHRHASYDIESVNNEDIINAEEAEESLARLWQMQRKGQRQQGVGISDLSAQLMS
jgi:hypothetical protein